MRMRASKINIVWNMRVRSNEKTKPNGHQHQQNGKALFAQTFLYSWVEWRLSNVCVVTVTALAGVDMAVVIAASIVVVVASVVSRRR